MIDPRELLWATLIALLVICAFPIVRAGPCGPVCDEAWSIEDSPLLAECNVTVAAGCSLTIEAGVEIAFPFGAGLVIDGELNVNGTADDPVELYSDDPDGGPYNWGGVTCQGESVCTISHAVIREASYGLMVPAGVTTLVEASVQNNGTGMWVSSNTSVGPQVSITHSEFSGNDQHGIRVNGGANPSVTITGSSIHSNGTYNYYVGTFGNPDTVLDARGNWWGSADPVVIREGIRDRADDSNAALVDWCGYLDAPDGSAVTAGHCADPFICEETVVWNQTDRPYELLSGTIVCATGELQIAPGVEVRVMGYSDLWVSGTLSVNGSVGSEVLFLPGSDAPGDESWGVILCQEGSTCTISLAEFQRPNGVIAEDSSTLELTDVTMTDASSGISIQGGSATLTRVTSVNGSHGVWLVDGTATLTDVTVLDHWTAGVKIEGGTATLNRLVSRLNSFGLSVRTGSGTAHPIVVVEDSEIAENNTGVSVGRNSSSYPDPSITVTSSSIYGNGENYYVSSFANPTVLDATGNWWGSPDPMVIREGIEDSATSDFRPTVNWCGYLDGPGGSAVESGICAGGTICDGTVVWDRTDMPYELLGDLFVCPTGELQILEGVRVHGLGATGLLVEGSLSASGSPGSEAVLTVANPSTGAGAWGGLNCTENATCSLSHAEVRHAQTTVAARDVSILEMTDTTVSDYHSGVRIADDSVATLTRASLEHGNSGIYMTGGTATLTDVVAVGNGEGFAVLGGMIELEGVVAQNNNKGLRIDPYDTAHVVVENSEFSSNSHRGIDFSGSPDSGSSLTVTGSSLHSNQTNFWGFSGSDYVLDARGNWWGSTDSQVIREGIVDGTTNGSGLIVDWCGYLDGPGGSPVTTNHCADMRVCGETIVWDQIDKPYELLTSVVVCETGELQIGAGVEVAAVEPGGLIVEGTLSVQGTAGADVSFRSLNPAAGPGAWPGVTCVGNSTCTMEHAEITQATTALEAQDTPSLSITDVTIDLNDTAIVIQDGTANLTRVSATNGVDGISAQGGAVVMTDVSAIDNDLVGVEVLGGTATLSGVVARMNWLGLSVKTGSPAAGPSVTVVQSEFVDNSGGVSVGRQQSDWPDPFLTVNNSSLHSNTFSNFSAGSFLEADAVVDATGNWWGSSDPMVIRERISDRATSTGSAWVDWCGYLDGPNGAPAPAGHCAGGPVCGEIEVWDLVDKPYELLTDVIVCESGELRIEPGVEVHGLANRTEIFVEGELTVNGAEGAEVVLRSGDPEGGAEGWPGVRCRESAGCTIAHAEIRDASVAVRAMEQAAVNLTDVRISDSRIGVLLQEESTGVLTGMSVTDNEWGLLLENDTTLLDDVIVTGHGETGVYVTSTADLVGVESRSNRIGLWVYSTSATSGSPAVNVAQSDFVMNDEYGIRVERRETYYPDPQVTVTAASLYGNGIANYSVGSFDDPATVLWTTDCWWGSMNSAVIGQGIFDHEDDPSSPHVRFSAFGESCEVALGADSDADGWGDFEDNCPLEPNADQEDRDGDGMGDPCDPDPNEAPDRLCNGIDDEPDGFRDSDGDGWGDPCDFQPTRADSYPGAQEICDGRDNDGDGVFALDELADGDGDEAITCGDCDDLEPEVYPCACEDCANEREDDCDGLTDGADPNCFDNPYCIKVYDGTPEPTLYVKKSTCLGGRLAGPFDVIRGGVSELQFAGGSVDLGNVVCVAGDLRWDRVTDLTPDPGPACNDSSLFYLARYTGASDFGAAYPGGEPRDTMNPDPVCP